MTGLNYLEKIKGVLHAPDQDTHIITINDLRELEFNRSELLNEEQRTALRSFDAFRLKTLNQIEGEDEFNKVYLQIQVMANLMPYSEFLKTDYR